MLLPTAAALFLAQTELIDLAPHGHVNCITSQVLPPVQTLAEWWGALKRGIQMRLAVEEPLRRQRQR